MRSPERSVRDIYPLSPLQAGMLFQHLLRPEDTANLVQQTYVIEGRLDADLFRRAWRVVAERHDALRTAVVWEGLDEPLQVVLDEVEPGFEFLDWRPLPERERDRLLAEFLDADWTRGIDLTDAPLLRLTLIRVAERRHLLVCTNHHIVLDGWSKSILLGEVASLYGATSGVPSEPVPYRAFVEDLRGRSRGAEVYWRDALAGMIPTPLAGREAGRPNGGRESIRLGVGEQETVRARELARRLRVSFATLLQSAWAAIMSAWTGSRDITYGLTLSGRDGELAAAGSIVGLLINTVPVRVRLGAHDTLATAAAALQRQLGDLRPHAAAPLTDVAAWAGSPAGEPLFDTLLIVDPERLQSPGDVSLSDVSP
ncbi:condensation domain-containing protein, partial [Streptosporangium sp. NPDC001681]|uniref:condensation domain-containing protein n=1 Tax=Streptosporangium sp. NPDC001681 TaxID=3154395 RepID=UPI003323A6CF